MSNAGNAYGIMQILIIQHQLVKEIANRYRVFINLRKLIHSAQLNIIFIKIWKLKFHGILSHFKTQCIDDTNGSVTSNRFYGIPWNWHLQFHGILWNLEYANFDDTSSSMEFHGTSSAPISMTRAVPWNSIEFYGTSSVPISLTRAIPWNSMEFQVPQFRWHEQFRGIPWNSTELGVRQLRWHEQFHRIPWNSMELQVRQFRWHKQFHGIPWNFKCANFDYTSNSMEFHETWSAPISLTRAVPWNYMEFHGTSSAPISLTRAVPWNSKEFHGTWIAPISMGCAMECANFADTSSSMEFDGIPWNFKCANFAILLLALYTFSWSDEMCHIC